MCSTAAVAVGAQEVMGQRVPQKFCTATRRGSAIRIGLLLRRQSRPPSTTRSSSATKRHTNASFVIVYAPILAICLLSTAILEAAIFISCHPVRRSGLHQRPSTPQCAGVNTGHRFRPPPLSLRQDYFRAHHRLPGLRVHSMLCSGAFLHSKFIVQDFPIDILFSTATTPLALI